MNLFKGYFQQIKKKPASVGSIPTCPPIFYGECGVMVLAYNTVNVKEGVQFSSPAQIEKESYERARKRAK